MISVYPVSNWCVHVTFVTSEVRTPDEIEVIRGPLS